jgi:hypothetical protein
MEIDLNNEMFTIGGSDSPDLYFDGTTLSINGIINSWNASGDQTKIDGGKIDTCSIHADSYKELRNTLIFNGSDSLDSSYKFVLPFKVISELRPEGIVSAKVSFKATSFRAYAKNVSAASDFTSCSGGEELVISTDQKLTGSWTASSVCWTFNSASTGNVCSWDEYYICTTTEDGSGDHCHRVCPDDYSNGLGHLHAVDTGDMDHSHPLPDHCHCVCTSSHTHAIPSHNHDITHGIFETDNSSVSITVDIDNGSGYNNFGAYTVSTTDETTETDLDITSLLTGTGPGWKAVRFSADNLCRIYAIIELKLDIDA